MNPVMSRIMNWTGTMLSVIGIGFVIMLVRDYYPQLNVDNLDRKLWSTVFGFSVIYGLANMILAFAWHELLKALGAQVDRILSLKIYGYSQLAKYLPGNIFHLAGRQALGMVQDIHGWILAKSSVWELVLISLAGVLYGLLVLPLIFTDISVPVSLSSLIFTVGIFAYLLFRFVGKGFSTALILYIIFLATTGVIFGALVDNISTSTSINWAPLIGAYVVAWLVGLITPGAPAGLGVRELVLIYLLRGVVDEADLLLSVLLTRLVTIAGDVIFYFIAVLIRMLRLDSANEH